MKWHALHRSRLLTRVLLRAILGRRRLAMAVILHGPFIVVTASLTLVGAIGLDRRVLRVVRVALVMKWVVGHERGRLHAHLLKRRGCS